MDDDARDWRAVAGCTALEPQVRVSAVWESPAAVAHANTDSLASCPLPDGQVRVFATARLSTAPWHAAGVFEPIDVGRARDGDATLSPHRLASHGAPCTGAHRLVLSSGSEA